MIPVNLTRIDLSLFTALLLVGTDLLGRAAFQGMEQALFSTVVEYCLKGFKVGKVLLKSGVS
jgi:hypothetical protein